MNDIKRLIKKNKEASIFALVIFSLIVFILIFRFFSDNQEGKALYGNRLEGLVKIKSSEIENAKKILSEKADEIEVRTQGRIIKISYKIKNGVTKEEIAEIITHVAFYVGWPKAWSAFNIAKEIYKD